MDGSGDSRNLAKAPSSKGVKERGCLGLLDVGFASALMFIIVFAQLLGLFKSIFENNGLTAFSLVKVANDISGLTVAGIVYITWFSLCFYSEKMNRWLNKKGPKGFMDKGIMRGGFLPIPAAMSVAVLLFVTGTFVGEEYKQGDYLLQAPFGQSYFSIWVAGKRCRANAVEDADMASVWGSRLDRRAPSPPKIAKMITGLLDGNAFDDVKKLKRKAATLGTQAGSCFTGGKDIIIPVDFEQSAILKNGKDNPDILNLLHPLNSTFQPDLTKLCFYQCIGWRSLELRTFLTNFGAIGAGGVLVIQMADIISNKYGFHMVDPETTPDELKELFGAANEDKPANKALKFFQFFRRSYSVTAIVLSSIYVLLKVFVSRLDADGYYTVDYYVTFTLVYSIIMVMIMRSWHLFEMAPQIFTRKLWNEGVDEFVVRADRMHASKVDLLDQIKEGYDGFDTNGDGVNNLKVVRINLYQWMHIARSEQYELLLNYARKPERSKQYEAARTELKQVVRGSPKLSMTGAPCKQVMTVGSVVVDVVEVHPENSERLIYTTRFTIPNGTVMIFLNWEDGNVASVTLDPDEPTNIANAKKLGEIAGKALSINAEKLLETLTKEWYECSKACPSKDQSMPRRLQDHVEIDKDAAKLRQERTAEEKTGSKPTV